MKMEHMRRLAGMGKAKVPSVVQPEDKDESVVFFREMYKREKYRDVNLLEPMYSVEFDAIQGGHVCRVPSGKRDFLIPVDEKHDYDWLMTPPTAPLFPSLDTEANSSRMVLQKELPIPPRPVKPPASRLSSKPDGATTSARPSRTASSSEKTTIVKGAPAVSKEKKQPRTADQRPSNKVTTNGKQKAAAAAAAVPGTRTSGAGAPKKHSERCYASQASGTSTVKAVAADQEVPFKAPKNLITTARSIFRRQAPPPAVSAQSKGTPPAVSAQSKGNKPAVSAQSKGPGSGVDVKKNGKATRQPCPPVATRGMVMTELRLQDRRNEQPPRGTNVAGSGAGGEPASSASGGGRAGRAALMKGVPKADGRAWV